MDALHGEDQGQAAARKIQKPSPLLLDFPRRYGSSDRAADGAPLVQKYARYVFPIVYLYWRLQPYCGAKHQ